MRIPRQALTLIICVSLFPVATGHAQEAQLPDTELLRAKVEQLEKTDIKSKSSSVQEIYKATLLRLYGQLNEALLRDAADLKRIQAAAGETGSDPQNRLAFELQRLKVEQELVAEKIRTLTGGEQANASSADLTPAAGTSEERVRAVEASLTGLTSPGSPIRLPRNIRTAANTAVLSDSPLPPADSTGGSLQNDTHPEQTVTVSGTVYVTNKYFYEQPENITVQRLQRQRLATRALTSGAQFSAQQAEQVEIARQENLGTASAVRAEYRNRRDVNHPLTNVEVKVEQLDDKGGKAPVKTTITGSLGNYQVSLKPGDYIISVNTENFSTSEPVTVPAITQGSKPDPIQQDLQIVVKPLGEFSRAIVGLEQAGASSAKGTQKYFFDLTVSTPLPFQKRIDPFFGARSRAWGTVRITTVPQQITASVGTFASTFATQVSDVKVNEVAQAAEFLAGVEYRLVTGGKMPFPFSSFDNSTTNKFTLSLIAGGGAITPLNPRDTMEVFRVPADTTGLPPEVKGKEFIAFISPNRDRFFRQFYAGIRAQTYYFNAKNDDIPLTRFPATLDITFGQNESVTGGRLRGGILRLEGFYPLPYENLKFINLFGTALMKLTRTNITDPLILEPAPAGTTVPGSNVLIVTVPQLNRDYYRIGVGIDFVSFVKSLGLGKNK